MERNSKKAKGCSVQDALLYSLDRFGEINFPYMSMLSGKMKEDMIGELYGVIFQNPEPLLEMEKEEWERADQYLSGNIYRKYAMAVRAYKKYGAPFEGNVKALQRIFPKNLAYADIYVTLGSPWLPTDIVDEFIRHLLGDYSQFRSAQYKVKHDSITGRWDIPIKSRYGCHHIPSRSKYGTPDINALTIIEKTLNHQAIVIKEPKKQAFSDGERTPEEATLVALEKQKLILQEFTAWLWSDTERAQRLIGIYQRNFGCYRAKHINGSFLQLKEMNCDYSLYPYQKDAVARILMTPNTLLAHDVGAGKTFIMIAAGMELRRLGKSKKNLYVVPNNILEQWERIFKKLYPTADVFVASPKAFTPKKRKDTLHRIKEENHDAILMAHSSFDSIGCSREWELKERGEEIRCMEEEFAMAGHETSLLKRQLTIKKKEFEDLYYRRKGHHVSSGGELSFDELGINTLFIDEAHHYKNIPLKSSITLLGINNTGSAKCEELMRKTRCVQLQNNGRGVVMATGTPITNSISDVYAFQKYLQYDELKMLGLVDFSDWVGMYAGQDTNFEIDVDTSNFRIVSRLSRFHNIPELTAIFSQVVDFYKVDQEGLPKIHRREDCVVPATSEFREFLEEISDRVDAIRARRTEIRKAMKPDFLNNRVRRKFGQADFKINDNMLCVTTDGRKGALDLRLVNYPVVNKKATKVYACARNVYDIYRRTEEERSTQLIFCDTSTPKKTFNVYDEMKKQLIALGVKAVDIAYVHDWEEEKKRQELFELVQEGKIRILLGSSFKLGIGVNVQKKLVALHHLDIPWRPADMIQREGRILRPGNTNAWVNIYRYVTEESFDAYSWQLLETKQRFISEILSGMAGARTGEEIGNTILDYAEIKALAIGDPNIKIRVMLNNNLVRLRTLQSARTEEFEELSLEQDKTEKMLQDISMVVEQLEEEITILSSEVFPNTKEKKLRKKLVEAKERKAFLQKRSEEIKDTLEHLPDYEEEMFRVQEKLDAVDRELGIHELTIRSRVLEN